MSKPPIDPDDFVSIICEKVGEGMSLSAVCRIPGMPGRTTIHGWILKNPSFRAAYEQAVALRGELLAEELEEIADEPIPDDLDGPSRSAWIQRQRLRVDTRKWSASKLAPKRYGDRVEIESKHTVGFDLRGLLAAREKQLQGAIFEHEAPQPAPKLEQLRTRGTIPLDPEN